RDWQAHAHRYLLRLTALLCVFLVPAFGVLFRAADPAAKDPLLARFGVAAVALGLLALTYFSAWARRRAAALLFLGACGLTGWSAVVAYRNGFSADYAVGLFFVWTSAALVVSLVFVRLHALAGFLLFAFVALIGLIVAHPAPEVDAAIYFAS